MNKYIKTDSKDPFHNLALEELMTVSHGEGILLFLWQNSNTVVIGRNQNPYRECAVDALDHDSGKLARRSSGGGAVYHDLGNLNFSFICRSGIYSVERQLGVIISAVRALGVEARFSGRNDIVTLDGAKFSGNAFWQHGDNRLHHGTILVDSDFMKLSKYLNPSKKKLESKQVESVRSRVTNLRGEIPSLTVLDAEHAVYDAFVREYGSVTHIDESGFDAGRLLALENKYSSFDWRFGAAPDYLITLENKFSWGELQLHLDVKKGVIASARVFSDALDWQLCDRLAAKLSGLAFEKQRIVDAVLSLESEAARDISAWLNMECI